MLLAIDCGNTNVVFAVYDGDTPLGQWRAATKTDRTSDEYGIWLTQLIERDGIKPTAVTHAIVASVVPGKNFDLKRLCQKYFNCEPMFVGDPAVDLGIAVRVDNPKEAGADRVINALAAHTTYGGPLIIIDFGTATTFDVIDRNGDYLGGAITVGIGLAQDALVGHTARLVKVDIAPPPHAIGRSTVQAMQSGLFLGYVALIEGMVARIVAELGEKDVHVIATGGLAELFAEHTAVIQGTAQTLTLDGLRLIWEMNERGEQPANP